MRSILMTAVVVSMFVCSGASAGTLYISDHPRIAHFHATFLIDGDEQPLEIIWANKEKVSYVVETDAGEITSATLTPDARIEWRGADVHIIDDHHVLLRATMREDSVRVFAEIDNEIFGSEVFLYPDADSWDEPLTIGSLDGQTLMDVEGPWATPGGMFFDRQVDGQQCSFGSTATGGSRRMLRC